MSAAEALRALKEQAHKAKFVDDYAEVAEPLVNALPLIAEVVEAAELIVPIAQDMNDDLNLEYGTKAEVPELNTLMAALTALREHLEAQ